MAMRDAHAGDGEASGRDRSRRARRLARGDWRVVRLAAGADLTKRVTFVRLENGEVDTTIRDDREAGTA